MLTRPCTKCGEANPDQLYPSMKAVWCKACYREWHRSRYTPRTGADDSVRPCAWCEKSYKPRQRRPSVYCSKSCKDTAKNRARQATLNAAKPARSCIQCGNAMPATMRADAAFCSSECNSAAHAITRKLAKRAAERRVPGGPLLRRVDIAERDLWRCGLCGGRVAKERRHPDPLCASIDHIVPLSQGGTNDLTNLQLAHLRCNLRKRATTHEKGELIFLEAS